MGRELSDLERSERICEILKRIGIEVSVKEMKQKGWRLPPSEERDKMWVVWKNIKKPTKLAEVVERLFPLLGISLRHVLAPGRAIKKKTQTNQLEFELTFRPPRKTQEKNSSILAVLKRNYRNEIKSIKGHTCPGCRYTDPDSAEVCPNCGRKFRTELPQMQRFDEAQASNQ